MTSLADYNNNPGNLRPPKGVTYDGQIGVDDNGFAIFENKSFGRNALVRDIQIKQKRGLNNPNDFLDVYAPASKENPEEGRQNYKMGLAGHLGLNSTKDPFPENSSEKIADYISSFESGELKKDEKKNDNIPESFTRTPVATEIKEEPETTTTQTTTPEKPSLADRAMEVGSYAMQKGEDNPDIVGLGGAGAAKGLLEKVFANPSANMMRQGETTPQQVDALKLKAGELQTKLQQTLEAAQTRQANGQDVGALRQRAEQLHQENLAAQRELRLAQERLKSLPRTAEVPVVTAASEVMGTPVEGAETRPGRASGPKIEGDSGVRNWTIQEAGQKHQMPEAILDMATDKTKESPTGGKALINKDLENLEKIKQIGGGDFRLTEAKPGQLMVPEGEANRLESELAERQSRQAADQARLAQEAETRRIAAEADLRRQRDAAQQRVEAAKERKMQIGPEASAARRQAEGAERTTNTVARQAEQQVANARIAANTASQTAREAAQAQPGTFTMMAREAGRRAAEKLPVIGNVLGAAGAGLSTKEAVDRYSQGDYSGAVLGAIEAALNAASMAPPTSPAGLAIKGVGSVGSLGMIPVWIAHDYFGNKGPWAPKKEPPKKARGGLTMLR
jgi:hypothetical protein